MPVMKRILVVDDNLMMRKLIRNIFSNEEYEIVEAEGGEICISKDGQYLYAAGSSDYALTVFARDSITGELSFQQILRDGANGVDGLEIARKNDIDLVVTDIIMPVMEGLELIMHLKRDFPDIKIIAISGGKPYYLYMAKKLGIEGIFTKPLNLHQFLSAVKKLIQFPKAGIISQSA